MTGRSDAGQPLETPALARVEGEGGMYVARKGGRVTDVQLRIYEPPRFFEAFLEGRSFTEPPDITARVCGICPVAYQMSACRAIEAVCGAEIEPAVQELRRLLYCGEWIESHALHIYFLHAPDFLGLDSAIELAGDDRESVERGLQLKKAGNQVIDVLGGRAIHPVNVRVGGFYRLPRRDELAELHTTLATAYTAAEETLEWVAGFDFPDADSPHELISLAEPDRYPIMSDRFVTSSGGEFDVRDFTDRTEEYQVAHSTAMHSRLIGGENYLVGPLARYNLHGHLLPEPIRVAAEAAGLARECRNPFQSIIVRAIEVLYACAESMRLIESYEPPEHPAAEVTPRAGVGQGASEAPRGTLYHRYELDDDGTIVRARMVPPTSQNQPTIEQELWHLVDRNPDVADDELRALCEQAIRNHDPCISCATHFLDLVVDDLD